MLLSLYLSWIDLARARAVRFAGAILASAALVACSGDEGFERLFRVQQNTLEQLIVFVPASFAFAQFVSPVWAPILGVIFIVGRFLYAAEYVKEPKTRTLGFALTFLPNAALLVGALIGVVIKII